MFENYERAASTKIRSPSNIEHVLNHHHRYIMRIYFVFHFRALYAAARFVVTIICKKREENCKIDGRIAALYLFIKYDFQEVALSNK